MRCGLNCIDWIYQFFDIFVCINVTDLNTWIDVEQQVKIKCKCKNKSDIFNCSALTLFR